MTLKFLDPVTIADGSLISSTRVENDYAAWSSGTTYALDDKCILTSTHRIYQSTQGSNANHAPATDDGTWWVDIGPTNRWAMFDASVGSVTEQATPLTVVLDPGIIGALTLLDIEGTSVSVTMTDGAGGPTVYSETFAIGDHAILLDWWMYFFSPITPDTTLSITDLPPYDGGRLTVSIAATATAKCGTLAIGDVVEVGRVRYGARVGIVDYSRKETSEYGITSVVKRAYAKRFDLDVIVDNAAVDYLASKLASIRATPVIWIGDDAYESLVAYGWVRDWGIVISYPTISEMSIEIEGLI